MFLQKLREDRGLSQSELALKLGITQSALCQYENGKRVPNANMLLNIARVLTCTVDELLRGPEVIGEWTPVWYRLLPRVGDVVIVTDGKTVTYGRYLGDDEWDTELSVVTHWTPFPIPPGAELKDELVKGEKNEF